jgi:ABC-2 type transport system permease protein
LSVLEVFYYSKDVDYLLPLPLKPTDIIISKFSVALVAQYSLLSLFYFPLMLVFGQMEGMSVGYYILSVVLFFLIPIFPTVLLCVLLMIFMRVTSIGKNRDLIRAIFMFLIIIASAAGGAMIGGQVDAVHFDLSAVMEMPVMRVITFIFRPVMMGVDVILNPTGEIVTFLLLLVIILASLAVFILVGKLLYLPTIVGYTDSQSKKEALTAEDLGNLSNRQSLFKTLLGREFKMIIRTPIFALNCFLLPLMMPIIMVIAGVFGGGGIENIASALEELQMLGFLLDDNVIASTIGILFAVLYFMTSYNTTALSSFSREGKTLFTWKYLPIKLDQIIKAKLLIAVCSNLLPMIFSTFGMVFLIGLSPLHAGILFVFMLAALTFSSLLFLLFDMFFPRLNWDSEQQAMKGGITQGFLVIGNMLIAVAIGLGAWFISNIWIVVILGILVPIGGSLVLLLVLQKRQQKLFERMG